MTPKEAGNYVDLAEVCSDMADIVEDLSREKISLLEQIEFLENENVGLKDELRSLSNKFLDRTEGKDNG